MNYLFVSAHPERRSLSNYLLTQGVAGLRAAGHEVEVSDLYFMKWKAVADADDFPQLENPEAPLSYEHESKRAFSDGTQSPDVMEEQRKLLWADAIILQFPLWWYGMPAILKGWVDRVYAYGFAYGIGPHGGSKWGDRFGEGTLQDKRGMIAMTVGGRMAHYGPRGVNGSMDDLMWPVQHGVLYYPGITVVPPAIFYEVGRADAIAVEAMVEAYVKQLLAMPVTKPIAFRPQNGGDYDDVQVLKPELDNGLSGHGRHQSGEVFVSNTWLGESGNYEPRHIAPTSRDQGQDK